MTTSPVSSVAQVRHFEDFRVGQRFSSGERSVTATDLAAFTELSGDAHPLHSDPAYAATTRFGAPILQGPFGLAVFFGLFHELGLAGESVVALLDTNWRYLKPIYVGDAVRFELTITGCRRTSGGDEGVVDRHVVLLNQHGEKVQEGTSAVLVRARERGEDPVHLAFGTVAWGEQLAALLTDDARFTSAAATWDGTIGLRCETREVQLRVYKGRIIDVARRTPHGSTFTVGAAELTWTELVTGPRNDFVQRAMRGQFEVTGSGYEYLRLTKVLSVLVDSARRLAEEGAQA